MSLSRRELLKFIEVSAVGWILGFIPLDILKKNRANAQEQNPIEIDRKWSSEIDVWGAENPIRTIEDFIRTQQAVVQESPQRPIGHLSTEFLCRSSHYRRFQESFQVDAYDQDGNPTPFSLEAGSLEAFLRKHINALNTILQSHQQIPQVDSRFPDHVSYVNVEARAVEVSGVRLFVLDDSFFDSLIEDSKETHVNWMQGESNHQGYGLDGSPTPETNGRFNLKGDAEQPSFSAVLESDDNVFDRTLIHELMHYFALLSYHAYNILLVHNQTDSSRLAELSLKSTYFQNDELGRLASSQMGITTENMCPHFGSIPTPFSDYLNEQFVFRMAETVAGKVQDLPLSSFEKFLLHILHFEFQIKTKNESIRVLSEMLNWPMPDVRITIVDESNQPVHLSEVKITEGVIDDNNLGLDDGWYILRPIFYYPSETTRTVDIADQSQGFFLPSNSLSGSALTDPTGERSQYQHLSAGRSFLISAKLVDGSTILIPLHSFNIYDFQWQSNNLRKSPLRDNSNKINLVFKKDLNNLSGASFQGVSIN